MDVHLQRGTSRYIIIIQYPALSCFYLEIVYCDMYVVDFDCSLLQLTYVTKPFVIVVFDKKIIS